MFSRHPQSELILIIEVQSRLVQSSLVVLKSAEKPDILFTVSTDISFQSHMKSGNLLKYAVKAITENVTAVVQFVRVNQSLRPSENKIKAHFVMSSPWTLPQSRIFKVTYAKDTQITRQSVTKVVEEDEKGDREHDSAHDTIIERKILGVRLNGYTVEQWENRFAKELQVIFVRSASGKQTIDLFSAACLNLLPHSKPSFHSSLFLQHLGLADRFADYDNYTLLHIHGELTDLALVQNRICVLFGSFPMGIETILRKISKISRTDERAAESLLSLYASNSLDTAMNKLIPDAMADISDKWLHELQEIVSRTTSSHGMLSPIVIETRKHSEFFVKKLKEAYPQSYVFEQSVDDLSQYVSFERQAERSYLAGLYAVALNALLSGDLL